MVKMLCIIISLFFVKEYYPYGVTVRREDNVALEPLGRANNVQDIEFARDIMDLEHISGENIGVTDISPLAGKTELAGVFFGDAGVTDISPIKVCHKLVMVGFNETQIGDI